MMPWLVFLFIGAMDWGFYADALIATEAAARVACLYTSSSSSTVTDSTTACTYALEQLRRMPNVGPSLSSCASNPVTVTASQVTGPDGIANSAAQVQVVYQTPIFIPMLGGGLPKQVTITKIIQMRVM